MRFLKTNTATRITVGPFLDKTDGITPEVALTATNEKLTLVVDDAGVPTLVLDTTATASGGANDLVHVTGDDAGFYDLELAAANVNYVGRAMLSINYVTDHCPVFHEFQILPADAYEAMTTATFAEATAVPAETASIWSKLNFLFLLARNKITQTATTMLVRNNADAGTVATSTVSDDGTTFTRGKLS